MELGIPSWSDFRDICIKRKNLNCQSADRGDYLLLIGPDSNGINWTNSLKKLLDDGSPNPDFVEFTETYESSFNWAVGFRAYPFATSDFDFAPKAGAGICLAGQSKSIYIPMCGTKYLDGGKLITDGNAAFGDWIDAACVDHDNAFGHGIDFILKKWINADPISWYVDWKACSETIHTPYAGLPPAQTYMMITYHSVGGSDVGFAVNLTMHKAL